MNENRMVFYLKANRINSYVLPNIKHWVDACMMYENSLIYIVCDNDELRERIINNIELDSSRVSFLASNREIEDMNFILNNICASKKWVRVGQAHLNTHWHADEIGCKFFWNIDADDTFVCLDPIRIVDFFKEIEMNSISNGIVMNGLDMWRSMAENEHWGKGIIWSLGITFVDNRVDWKQALYDHCIDNKFKDSTNAMDMDANLDWYFTYLKNAGVADIETFYFENLKFLHFYDYFINYPHLSSFSHWSEGRLRYPILEACYGSKARSSIPIASDLIRLDIGIKDDESLLALISISNEVFSFWGDVRNEELDVGNLISRRCKYLLDIKDKKQLVCWGAGNAFYRYKEIIKKAYNLKYVCDNSSVKWGKELDKGIVCISPEELEKMKEDVFVVVLIDSPAVNYKIIHQLLNMGITEFDHYDNWIEQVEGVSN